MSVPKFTELYVPILQLLADGRQYKRCEIVESIADTLKLSEAERSEMTKSGRETYLSRQVYWATRYLILTELIKQVERDNFIITDEGLKAVRSGEVIGSGTFADYQEL